MQLCITLAEVCLDSFQHADPPVSDPRIVRNAMKIQDSFSLPDPGPFSAFNAGTVMLNVHVCDRV